jgi:hypothetical protein
MTEWTREVKETLGTLLGMPIRIVVEGATVAEHGPQPRDLELIDEILASLPSTLRKAEAALAEHERNTQRDYATHIKNPHVWIRDDRDDPREWTLIVERDDWPDFGWHIEFRGSELVEIWAGD